MANSDRREFIKHLYATSAVLAGGLASRQLASGQSSGPARVVANASRVTADLDPKVFGAFLEHLGRAVYEGVYEPGSRNSNADGFRTDVADTVRELNVPIIRYPGGNMVSGYNWLDGVGPKSERPTVLERAWNSIETNQFGTNEFMDWCKMVGTEPLLGCNFGTGSVEEAVAYVEYCNLERGTKWSDLRRSHGYEQPHKVKYWCLGNEMDGPWQIGRMPATDYGRKARDAARQFRIVDNDVELIACGSSGATMDTYLVWDRQVLEECYDQVDGLSLHVYYGNLPDQTGGDTARYLALNLDMEDQIQESAAVCDYVQGLQKSRKRLWLSFDEWNVWYRARGGDFANGKKTFAPHLLEEVYNLEDALLVGGMLNTLIRNADRVKIGCLAQIVNVIAPIVATDQGVLRQSTFYPYAWAIQFAKGKVLDLDVESDSFPIDTGGIRPTFARRTSAPYLDVVATIDEENGQASVLMLNRDLDAEREVTIEWRGINPTRVLSCQTLTGSDMKAFNTFDEPNKVAPQTLDAPAASNSMTFKLPAGSYSVAQVAIS